MAAECVSHSAMEAGPMDNAGTNKNIPALTSPG